MRDDWKKSEGQVVNNKYPLERLLGNTNHSAVFFTQYGSPKPIHAAIKFISVGAQSDSQLLRWHRASQTTHPNLLRLYHAGRCQLADMDLVYVVMEYAEENLGQILPHRPLTTKETREMLGPLIDALIYLHGRGLAHSHIKPSNVMAVGDHLKLSSDAVLPFGEPRSNHRSADAYDAPETESSPLAGPSDVWSLGMTLVETFTRGLPVSLQESQAEPTVPATLPQPFLDIVRKSLRRNPVLRWTPAQIADRLNPASVAVTAPELTAEKAAPIKIAAPEMTASAEKAVPIPDAAAEITASPEKTPAVPVSAPELTTEKAAPAKIVAPEMTASAEKAAPIPDAAAEITAGHEKTAPVPVATPQAPASAEKPTPVPVAAPELSVGKTTAAAAELWDDITYTWVVLCKNYFFHMRQNLFFRHRIPLAYTDPFSPVPAVDGPFEVRCDDCGKTYVYKRSNLRRYQGDVPKFTTHPLF